MRRIVLVALAAVVAVCAQTGPGTGLPVKRVLLYKNGVGYFEHVGKVTGDQSITVSFTSAQLNDVLKSLTVLDLGGGRITGVNYGSVAPLERRVGDLHLVGEKTTLTEVLTALRGANLEVRNGASVVTGRLLSIERKTRISGGTTLEVDYLSLVTPAGEVKTTELSPAYSVKILDHELNGKMGRYLDVIGSAHDSDLRRMTVETKGTGERGLFLSYISEVPVWKTTYRLVLPVKQGAKPLLQGWAIVDNTVGEDWSNVELSLVAGAPQSFVQNLSQPDYVRRPEIARRQVFQTAPQTHEATLMGGSGRVTGTVLDASGAALAGATVRAVDANGNVVGTTTSNATGWFALSGLPDGLTKVEFEAPGFKRTVVYGVAVSAAREAQAYARMEMGSVSETVTVTAEAGSINASASMIGRRATTGSGRALGSAGGVPGGVMGGVIGGVGGGVGSGSGGGVGGGVFRVGAAMGSAQLGTAAAQDMGDLFEYRLKEPITIRKNQSAMVPVVNVALEAEKVSLWNDASGMRRPQRALWLNNTSDLTFDGGTFTVLEEDAFAGEGIFDTIHAGERRLVSYATDLAITPGARDTAVPQRVTHVKVAKGVMIHTSEMRETRTYTFRNEAATARTVLVEHPVRNGYELRSAKPAETTAQWMRFRVPVEPKQTTTFVVEEVRPLQTSYTIGKVNREQLAVFVSERSIPKAVEDGLLAIMARRDSSASLAEKKEEREQAIQRIFDDQQRLRENLKALKGTPDEKALVQRYTKQLDAQENELEKLRTEVEDLTKQIETVDHEVEQMVEQLSFDGAI